jgi:isoleucyl-tRNA synthetase
MSKSLGNIILPSVIVEGGKNLKKDPEYGADLLRLWITSSDYSNDISIGPKVLSGQFEFLKKIRNTAKFLLGNLSDFKKEDIVPYSELTLTDRYFLFVLNGFIDKIEIYYENYEFNKSNLIILK